jgi:hypothetical protein
MIMQKSFLILISALVVGQLSVSAQFEFQVIFRGASYQTNGNGQVFSTLVTEQTILQDAAQAGGITDLSTLALVYHVQGSSFGDTIDVVNATNGIAYKTVFGFFFGDDPSLNRVAITNSPGTQVMRVDYIYTDQNSHSMGAAFVTKMYNSGGQSLTSITGRMQWIVNPIPPAGTKVCYGSFTATDSLF